VNGEKVSRSSYASESSEDSLNLRKSTEKLSNFDYTNFDSTFGSSMEMKYESPEQSEPEDLSTKSYVRKKEKRD
jgi:aromatic ring hydroxylase